MACQVGARVTLTALPGVPLVQPGDDLARIARDALARVEIALAAGDVLVVTSKIVSRAEDRFVDLSAVDPSERALELGREVGKDPRVVELILRESLAISRKTTGALVVRHRLGAVFANAGIDASNAVPAGAAPGSGPWVLLLPADPDASAERLRRELWSLDGPGIGVVISDSLGRPFRLGTVGAAIGVSGLPPLWDQRGRSDLFGRTLEQTITALADQVAAAADMVSGQANEATPLVHVRGLSFQPSERGASALIRPPNEDVYA